MPNLIDESGLQTKTYDEILLELTTAFQGIYGADINVDPDSDNGQEIGIWAQAALDNLDLLAQVYSSFDPDTAVGRALDERCAINGVQRLGGTYTRTNITIVTDRALTIEGLDGDIESADGVGYTVADNAGVQWILAETQNPSAAGTYVYSARAKNVGAVLTSPNTITVPVTVVLGVVSINNPTTYSVLGIDEETDADLRIRRQQSVALSSKGYLDGLEAALLNISGVTAAIVYENNTGSTDDDDIPEHSIWVIVAGGEDADIGQAIYSKRNAGCGMRGDEVVNVVRPNGSIFQAKFDRTATEDLYIRFTAESINGEDPIDSALIKDQLVELLSLGVFEAVNVNDLATLVRQIDSNCLVTIDTGDGFGLSGGGTFYNTLEPSAKNKQFTVDAANIVITEV